MLNGTDFDGRKVNVEVTDQPEGQRGGEKKRGGKEGGGFRSVRGERNERRFEEKKSKKGSGVIRGAAAKPAKPSREERGYTAARGPKGAAEWAKFFEGQVEGQPFYETFKKKKKK